MELGAEGVQGLEGEDEVDEAALAVVRQGAALIERAKVLMAENPFPGLTAMPLQEKTVRGLRDRQDSAVDGEEDGQRNDEGTGRSYSFLYERIGWIDESRTSVRRQQPAIERWWDDSKKRVGREAERKLEVERQVEKASESVFTPMGRQRKIKAEQMIHRRYAQQEADRKAERAGGFVSKIGVAVKDASPEKIEEERLARMRKFDAMWSRNSFAWSGAAIKGSKGAVESGHPACQTAMAKLGAADGRHAMVVGWLRVGYGDIHGCMALPGAKRGHRYVIASA